VIPDYELMESQITNNERLILTHEEILAKHPSEYFIANKREKLDYASKIGRNEFLIFNLPKNVSIAKLNELCTAKGVQIMDISITMGLD
jgi:hypothetical protein